MNTQPIIISCIVTSYRRDKSIVKRALDSILLQTFTDYEILLIDDNRGEESAPYSAYLEELASLSDKISLLKTEGGHGAQKARNTGIKHSRGKYLAFLDDDDEWLPTKLAKQLSLMEADLSVGMCYCDSMVVNENFDPPKIITKKTGKFVTDASYSDMLRRDNVGSTSKAMIRENVFDAVGLFDESLPARQDYEMWIRISRSFPIRGVDEKLVKYHISGGSEQISKNWDNCIDGHTKLYVKYKEDIDKDPRARFNIFFYLAHYKRMKGNNIDAVKLYIKSFFTSPRSFLEMAVIKLNQKKGEAI